MIKFNKVTKKFGSEKAALADISFEIESGELVVITGKSGSGKTTLLRLLTGDTAASDGEVFFGKTAVHKIKSGNLPHHRRKIGVVFQDYKLLPELNIWENIALALSIINRPGSEIEEKVTDLLKLVDLTDKAFLFPHQLSGGEAQRIAIARALSVAPEVIFADEPTGNLDAQNSKSIALLLKKINDLGTTVLVTTHDPVVIKELSKGRTISLEEGKLIKDSGAKKSSKKESEKEEKKSEDSKDDSDQEKDKDKGKEKQSKNKESKNEPKSKKEPETDKKTEKSDKDKKAKK